MFKVEISLKNSSTMVCVIKENALHEFEDWYSRANPDDMFSIFSSSKRLTMKEKEISHYTVVEVEMKK